MIFIYIEGQAPVNTGNISLIQKLYDGDKWIGLRFSCTGGHQVNWRFKPKDDCGKAYEKILQTINAQEMKL